MSDPLFLLPSAIRRADEVDAWFARPDHELRRLVQPWFEQIRALGDDVRELIHDGCPTACVGDAAFVYVNAFSAHAAVGFFHGASLYDPTSLLEGSGKRMRHVKLRWGQSVNEAALAALIGVSYRDIHDRIAAELK